MNELAIILITAAVGFAAAMALRLPAVPFLLLAGFAASFTPWAPDKESTARIVEFGLAFLLFAAGLELSPRRFTHQTRAVMWVAGVQFLVVGLAAFAVATLLGYDPLAAAYIGFAVSASSTLVVVRHLRALRQMFQPFGRLVTGVLLLQDAAVILLLAILAVLPMGLLPMAGALGSFILLAGVAVICHYFVMPRIFRMFESDDELLLLIGLASLFGFIALAWLLRLPLITGAFLAGFALSCFPVNGLLRGLTGSLNDFFHALFFVSLGLLLQTPGLALVGQALLLAVLVFVLTPPLVAAIAEWQGQSSRSGIESGLLLAQTSELGIILGLSGLYLGHLDADGFTLIALVAAITMSLTPFLATDKLTWKLTHLQPSFRRRNPNLNPPKNHVLVLGFGSAGMWVIKPLIQAGHEILVVDDDPVVIQQLARTGIACQRGDGSDDRVLESSGARHASLVIASIPRIADLVKIIHICGRDKVIARVFEEADAEAIRQAGGLPVLNSEAAAEQFLEWFDKVGPAKK